MNAYPRAVLLGTGETALAVARSLGARGVPVIVSGPSAGTAARSRFCAATQLFDDPALAAASWTEWLLGRDAPLAGSVVLSTCDEGLDFVARHHAALAARYRLDMFQPGLHLALLDKQRTLELGRAAGVAIPSFWSVAGGGDLRRALDEVRYPAIIKPIHSHLFRAQLGVKHLPANDADELVRNATVALDGGHPFMLCEMIPGPDSLLSSYYTYLTPEGERLFDFTKRVMRRYPANEGGATYHLTERLPRTAEAGRRFFAGIGFQGLGNVEFKLDRRDGELKLIECNARFTAAQALLAAAGVDTAWLAYRRALGEQVERIETWREGLCLWAPLADFRAFRQLRGEGKLGAAAWLRSVLRPALFPQFSIGDPMPAWKSAARELDGWMRRRRARRKSASSHLKPAA